MYIENMSEIKITHLEYKILEKLRKLYNNNGKEISYSELYRDKEIRKELLPNAFKALAELKYHLKRLRELGLIQGKVSPKIKLEKITCYEKTREDDLYVYIKVYNTK